MPRATTHGASTRLKTIITNVDFPALVAETHPIVHNKVCCPFHHDSSPSCHIYEDHYFCFACSASGDALVWLEHVHKLSKADAIKELERRSGGQASVMSHQPKMVEKPRAVVKVCDSQPLPQNAVDLQLKRASRLERIPLALEGRGFTLKDLQSYWIASENEDALIPIFNPDGFAPEVSPN
jgi:DNA primase